MGIVPGRKRDRQQPLRRRLVCLTWLILSLVCAWQASAEQPIHLTFQTDEKGKPPLGWVSKNKDPGRVYTVQEEGGRRYLRADAQDASIQLGYEKQWPLGEYPILQWQWRAVLFPAHSDERKKSGADSALGLYVVFGHWPFIRSIKYVWSDTLPVGESFDSPFSSRAKIVVIRSGRALEGTWVAERRDVLADYRRLFNAAGAAPAARGIAVLTDSDNTHSRAVGDYADIEALTPRLEKTPPIVLKSPLTLPSPPRGEGKSRFLSWN